MRCAHDAGLHKWFEKMGTEPRALVMFVVFILPSISIRIDRGQRRVLVLVNALIAMFGIKMSPAN